MTQELKERDAVDSLDDGQVFAIGVALIAIGCIWYDWRGNKR